MREGGRDGMDGRQGRALERGLEVEEGRRRGKKFKTSASPCGPGCFLFRVPISFVAEEV